MEFRVTTEININLKNLWNKWVKVFKNGPSKICERQSLKKLTWSILEYFVTKEIKLLSSFNPSMPHSFRTNLTLKGLQQLITSLWLDDTHAHKQHSGNIPCPRRTLDIHYRDAINASFNIKALPKLSLSHPLVLNTRRVLITGEGRHFCSRKKVGFFLRAKMGGW